MPHTSPRKGERGSVYMLITVFVEYAGGTYLSQTTVDDSSQLAEAVLTSIDWKEVNPMPTEHQLRALGRSLALTAPVAVAGLRGVWCLSGLVGDSMVLAHVVETKA